MKLDRITIFWQLNVVGKRLNRNAVVSLFALLNCARPLAGPPDHRAGSAYAPDPQASAVTSIRWWYCRETHRANHCTESLSQLIRSLAPIRLLLRYWRDDDGHDCVNTISALSGLSFLTE